VGDRGIVVKILIEHRCRLDGQDGAFDSVAGEDLRNVQGGYAKSNVGDADRSGKVFLVEDDIDIFSMKYALAVVLARGWRGTRV
jgi:hypothetical protein